MNSKIINGIKVADLLQKQIYERIQNHLVQQPLLFPPKIAFVLIGESTASESYVKRKINVSNKLGIKTELHQFPGDVQEQCVIDRINKLNDTIAVDGILVQLPVPGHLDRSRIIHSIHQQKDVDCLHSANLQNLLINGELQEMLPCTPAGIIALLDYHKVDLKGMVTTVIGRSHLVGFPLSLLLMKRNATVTVCHRQTTNIREQIQNADLVISAAGKRHLVKGEWIKQGAIVIDVGINQAQQFDPHKIVGDVEFEKALPRCSLITPVPGGVGPMTICRLMMNLQNIWCKNNNLPIEYPILPSDYLQE